MTPKLALKDYLLLLLVLGTYAGLYLLNNNIQLFEVWKIPQTVIDLKITFSPYWIYIYLSAYLMPVFMFFYLSRLNLHVRYLQMFFVLTILSNIIFFAFPSTITRPVVSVEGLDAITKLAFDLLFSADKPFNCLPSTHVSTSLIAAFVVRQHTWKYFFFFTMSLLISYSAVAIGQHFFYDALAGAAIALISYQVQKRMKFPDLFQHRQSA